MGLKVSVYRLSAADTDAGIAQTIEFLSYRDAIEIRP